MSVSATPTKYDPKVLFQGALSTTLTTTLVTGASARGTKIIGIVVCNTGATTRNITMDYFKATTGRKFLPAWPLAPGLSIDVLALIGLHAGMPIDSGDLVRGGQDTGSDVDCIITGYEMDT